MPIWGYVAIWLACGFAMAVVFVVAVCRAATRGDRIVVFDQERELRVERECELRRREIALEVRAEQRRAARR
jgi:hypothetical protein